MLLKLFHEAQFLSHMYLYAEVELYYCLFLFYDLLVIKKVILTDLLRKMKVRMLNVGKT